MVKGRADSTIGSLQQLGLADSPIRVSLSFRSLDIHVDAWGNVPAEVQNMLTEARIHMRLVHFDRAILDVCVMESMAGAPAIGAMRRAGARMGNNLPRFAPGGSLGNHYIGLNIASPIGNLPWRFWYTYLAEQPMIFPLGAERSLVDLAWRAIPYTTDPWGTGNIPGSAQPSTVPGTGAEGAVLWDHVLDV